MEPQCNGAGEMPGQEGRDPELEHFNQWVEDNQDNILEAWIATLTFNDVPDEFVNDQYSASIE